MSGFKPSALATDLKAEVDGVWVDYQGGSKLKVARYNNDAAQKLRRKLVQKDSMIISAGGDAAETLLESIDLEVASKCILVDWEGFSNDDDSDMEYTVCQARYLMKNFKDFREDVMNFAGSRDRYKLEAIKADSETLKP